MVAIRSSVVALVGVALVVTALPAAAQENPSLEIDRFPKLVSHGQPVAIVGHVEGDSVPGTVALQRRFTHTDWSVVAKAAPDSSRRVRFELDAPRFSGRYRLKIEGAHSALVIVRVRPKLNMKLSRRDVMEGARVTVAGSLRPAVPRREATLKWRVDGTWRTLKTLRVGDGRFRVRLRDLRHGRRPIRISFRGDERNSWARTRDLLKVHDREPATWYGPGFFGNRTACGQRYHRDLLGVAHRTLPCGTMVSALYRGRTVRVPVVDRGPYGRANWDLTEETAQRLRFSGRDEIGVLRHRS